MRFTDFKDSVQRAKTLEGEDATFASFFVFFLSSLTNQWNETPHSAL